MLNLLAVLALAPTAHVIIRPRDAIHAGDSSVYVDFRVMFGDYSGGMPTTGVDIEVPTGISHVNPEAISGWTINVKQEEVEVAHNDGSHTWSTVPTKVEYRATDPKYAVDAQHLMKLHMGIVTSCYFNDANTNTVWNNLYTLWWKTTVYSSTTGTLDMSKSTAYTAVKSGDESLYSTYPQLPAAYMRIVPAPGSCSQRGGIEFAGTFVAEDANYETVNNKQDVLALIDQEVVGILDEQLSAQVLEYIMAHEVQNAFSASTIKLSDVTHRVATLEKSVTASKQNIHNAEKDVITLKSSKDGNDSMEASALVEDNQARTATAPMLTGLLIAGFALSIISLLMIVSVTIFVCTRKPSRAHPIALQVKRTLGERTPSGGSSSRGP